MTTLQHKEKPQVMSLFYLALKLVAVTGKLNKTVFGLFEERLRDFFNNDNNAEVRLFFGYSQNFGHRATTVNLMFRLLSYFPANKARTIRIIYDIDSENEEGPTPEQSKQAFCNILPKLIPGLSYDTVFNAQPFVLTQTGYANVTLQFNAYNPGNEEAPFDPVLTTNCFFAITGGFDNSNNLTEDLRVQCLLSLSPYQFVKDEALNTIYFRDSDDEGILLGPRYNENGTQPIIGKPGKFGLTYTKRAYFTPDPNISSVLWDLFRIAQPNQYAVVQRLIQLQDDSTAQLMPFYYSKGRIWGTNTNVLFNMTSGLFRMKALRTATGKANSCSVVVVFGGVDNLDYNSFRGLVGVPRTDGAASNGPSEDCPRLRQYLQLPGVHNSYLNNMRILAATADPDNITAAVDTVGTGGIVFVNLGAVPQYVFNLIFHGAHLPAVFEGEGSASMILNAGIPFLHLVSQDVEFVEDAETARTTNQLYPTIPLNAEESAVATQCHLDSLKMLAEPEEWEAALAGGLDTTTTPGAIVGQFIYDAYTEGTAKYNYFMSMRPFFNDAQNDKLMMALMYTLAEIDGRQ